MEAHTSLALQHVIRPAKNQDAPLLILLHGYGSHEQDLFSFAPELSQEFFIVSARAPHDLQPHGAAWYAINFDATGAKFTDTDQALESMNLLLQFIKECRDNYPVNQDPISILGFSQGAILSYGLSLSYPQLFKNVVAMSGYVDESLILDRGGMESRFRESETQPAYFISHGTMDQVVPYDWAKKAPAFMDAINADYLFKDYPIGHGVARDNFYDMKAWLEARI